MLLQNIPYNTVIAKSINKRKKRKPVVREYLPHPRR